MRRTSMFVNRTPPLGDHALPAFAGRAFPGIRVVERGDSLQRRLHRQLLEQRAAFFQWQRSDVTIAEPHDIEHVIGAGAIPRNLTVEDQVVARDPGDGAGNSGNILGETIAREELHLRASLEGDQADAVKLAFEDPVGPGESILGQRRGHWLDPFGWRRSHTSEAISRAREAWPRLASAGCRPHSTRRPISNSDRSLRRRCPGRLPWHRSTRTEPSSEPRRHT